MRRTTFVFCGLLLMGIGYVAGTRQVELTQAAHAQDAAAPGGADTGVQLAEETTRKIHDAKLALQDAVDALEVEGKYATITDGINAFLVLTGGGNALEDLESGQGVDPETFAALYAGLAIPEVADNLAKDDQGRLTYQGKVVRMYSQSRLEQSFEIRRKLANPGQ